MKYHPALGRLLDDHKQCLFLANVCKKRHTQPKGIPRTPNEKALFARGYLRNLMLDHFAIEEEILLEGLRHSSIEYEEMIARIRVDHIAIRSILGSFNGSNANADLLEEFANLLETHIYEEERVIYPRIQSIVPLETLDLIGIKIDEYMRNLNSSPGMPSR
jgi:hemerythrin-like domain-containing protein